MSKRARDDDSESEDDSGSQDEDQLHPVFGLPEMVGEILKHDNLSPIELIDLLQTQKATFKAQVLQKLKDPAYWQRAFQLHFGHLPIGARVRNMLRIIRDSQFQDYVRAVDTANNFWNAATRHETAFPERKWTPLEQEMNAYSHVARNAIGTAIGHVGSYVLQEFDLPVQSGRVSGNGLRVGGKMEHFDFMKTDNAADDAATGFEHSGEASRRDLDYLGRHLYDMVSRHWGTVQLNPAEQEGIWWNLPAGKVTFLYRLHESSVKPDEGEVYVRVGRHDVRLPTARELRERKTSVLDVQRVTHLPAFGTALYVESVLRVRASREFRDTYDVERTLKLHHVAVWGELPQQELGLTSMCAPWWPHGEITRYGINLQAARETMCVDADEVAVFASDELVPVMRPTDLTALYTELVALGHLKSGEKLSSLNALVAAVPQLSQGLTDALGEALYGFSVISDALGDAHASKRNALGVPNMYRVPALPSHLAACAVCANTECSHVDPVAQRAYCARCAATLDA